MILLITVIFVFAGGSFNIYYAYVSFLYVVLIVFSQLLSLIMRLLI
jgi:hypothetical protein